jgi:hypothetical protein
LSSANVTSSSTRDVRTEKERNKQIRTERKKERKKDDLRVDTNIVYFLMKENRISSSCTSFPHPYPSDTRQTKVHSSIKYGNFKGKCGLKFLSAFHYLFVISFIAMAVLI